MNRRIHNTLRSAPIAKFAGVISVDELDWDERLEAEVRSSFNHPTEQVAADLPRLGCELQREYHRFCQQQ